MNPHTGPPRLRPKRGELNLLVSAAALVMTTIATAQPACVSAMAVTDGNADRDPLPSGPPRRGWIPHYVESTPIGAVIGSNRKFPASSRGVS